MIDLDAFQMSKAFRRRQLSPVEVARDALMRAQATQPTINAFALLDEQRTLAWAGEAEARWRAGAPLSPFDGVPVTVKDNMAVAGWPSRKGSQATSADPMTFDAPVVARSKEAGLVILGLTTMPEFGWKGLSDSPLTGATRNPWNLARTAGGSTAGGAAAAALRIGRFHLGSDGLGSIRIPAAYCGAPGLKPTYGRVPAYPISVMGGLAHLGPIAPTVAEVAAFLSILSGPDGRDPDAWNTTPPDFSIGLEEGVKGLRIAYSPRLGFIAKVDPVVERVVAEAALVFESLGAVVEHADPPTTPDALAIADRLWNAGAAFALSAFTPEQHAVMDPGLVACMTKGRETRATELIDLLLYQRARHVIAMDAFHQRYDLLITPTMPTGAIPLGADLPPAGFGGVADWGPLWTDWSPFTPPFNVTQQPAASAPCGFDGDGLPVGLQIIGPKRGEATVLKAMRAFEAARPFARPTAPT